MVHHENAHQNVHIEPKKGGARKIFFQRFAPEMCPPLSNSFWRHFSLSGLPVSSKSQKSSIGWSLLLIDAGVSFQAAGPEVTKHLLHTKRSVWLYGMCSVLRLRNKYWIRRQDRVRNVDISLRTGLALPSVSDLTC